MGTSALGHRWLIALLAVAGLAVGLVYGLLRPPVYSAQARIVVGTNATLVNVASSAGLPAAEQAFASEYARLATVPAVEASAARSMGVTSIPGSLSATPIADSNIIEVNATASTQADALGIASAGATALVAEIDKLNTASDATVKGLITQYNQLEAAIASLTSQVGSVHSQLASSTAGSAQAQRLQQEYSNLQAQISTNQLEATAVSNQYQSEYSPVQSEAQTVQISSPGSALGSDRKSWLEIGLLAGLVGGGVVGLAIGVGLDIRSPRTDVEDRPSAAGG